MFIYCPCLFSFCLFWLQENVNSNVATFQYCDPETGFPPTDVWDSDPGAAADGSGRYLQLPGNLGNIELEPLWLPCYIMLNVEIDATIM